MQEHCKQPLTTSISDGPQNTAESHQLAEHPPSHEEQGLNCPQGVSQATCPSPQIVPTHPISDPKEDEEFLLLSPKSSHYLSKVMMILEEPSSKKGTADHASIITDCNYNAPPEDLKSDPHAHVDLIEEGTTKMDGDVEGGRPNGAQMNHPEHQTLPQSIQSNNIGDIIQNDSEIIAQAIRDKLIEIQNSKEVWPIQIEDESTHLEMNIAPEHQSEMVHEPKEEVELQDHPQLNQPSVQDQLVNNISSAWEKQEHISPEKYQKLEHEQPASSIKNEDVSMIVNISEEKQYLFSSEPRLQEFNQTDVQAEIPENHHQEEKAVEQLQKSMKLEVAEHQPCVGEREVWNESMNSVQNTSSMDVNVDDTIRTEIPAEQLLSPEKAIEERDELSPEKVIEQREELQPDEKLLSKVYLELQASEEELQKQAPQVVHEHGISMETIETVETGAKQIKPEQVHQPESENVQIPDVYYNKQVEKLEPNNYSIEVNYTEEEENHLDRSGYSKFVESVHEQSAPENSYFVANVASPRKQDAVQSQKKKSPIRINSDSSIISVLQEYAQEHPPKRESDVSYSNENVSTENILHVDKYVKPICELVESEEYLASENQVEQEKMPLKVQSSDFSSLELVESVESPQFSEQSSAQISEIKTLKTMREVSPDKVILEENIEETEKDNKSSKNHQEAIVIDQNVVLDEDGVVLVQNVVVLDQDENAVQNVVVLDENQNAVQNVVVLDQDENALQNVVDLDQDENAVQNVVVLDQDGNVEVVEPLEDPVNQQQQQQQVEERVFANEAIQTSEVRPNHPNIIFQDFSRAYGGEPMMEHFVPYNRQVPYPAVPPTISININRYNQMSLNIFNNNQLFQKPEENSRNNSIFQPAVIQEKAALNLSETILNNSSINIVENIQPIPESPVRIQQSLPEPQIQVNNQVEILERPKAIEISSSIEEPVRQEQAIRSRMTEPSVNIVVPTRQNNIVQATVNIQESSQQIREPVEVTVKKILSCADEYLMKNVLTEEDHRVFGNIIKPYYAPERIMTYPIGEVGNLLFKDGLFLTALVRIFTKSAKDPFLANTLYQFLVSAFYPETNRYIFEQKSEQAFDDYLIFKEKQDTERYLKLKMRQPEELQPVVRPYSHSNPLNEEEIRQRQLEELENRIRSNSKKSQEIKELFSKSKVEQKRVFPNNNVSINSESDRASQSSYSDKSVDLKNKLLPNVQERENQNHESDEKERNKLHIMNKKFTIDVVEPIHETPVEERKGRGRPTVKPSEKISKINANEKKSKGNVVEKPSQVEEEQAEKANDNSNSGSSASRFNSLYEKYKKVRESKNQEPPQSTTPQGILKNSKEKEVEKPIQESEVKQRKNVQFAEDKITHGKEIKVIQAKEDSVEEEDAPRLRKRRKSKCRIESSEEYEDIPRTRKSKK